MNSADLLLYAVTDRSWLQGRSLVSVAGEALEGGVTFLQLREKHQNHDTFLAEARELKTLCALRRVPFVINDDVEIARACDADGVHIGQCDMELTRARQILGPEKIIGVSAQTVEQALTAERNGADYLGVGAMFPTATKGDAEVVPMETLKAITSAVKIPVVVIGGINEERLPLFSGSGACGAAIVSAIFAAPDVQRASGRLLALCRKVFS